MRNYLVTYLADQWRSQGHSVDFLFGTKKFIPADACFLHIDLSVVPDHYLEFASRYPVTINGSVTDVRKRRYSRNIVCDNDDYPHPVIVKTDLNFAGWPERFATYGMSRCMLLRLKRRLGLTKGEILRKDDYQVYASAADVPHGYFENPDYIVEKFLPERSGESYCLNMLKFLGGTSISGRLFSKIPVITNASIERTERSEPHPEIFAIRRRLGIDYGKIDYCVHDGKVVILDVNKTIGLSPRNPPPEFLSYVCQIASGIDDFL